jgi:acyl carrier protein phosphodiesterase
MNFLAHIYLSDNDPELQIGNFIGDHVKGKNYLSLPQNIADGVIIHRKIDTFTDSHPVFRQSKRYFQPEYGLYSGVIVDMVYDHFLAKNWDKFHPVNLYNFTQNFYTNLNSYLPILPEKTQIVAPYLIQENWLYSYKTIEGITKTLERMDARTKNLSKMRFSYQTLTQHYQLLEYDFFDFIVEVYEYSQTILNQRKKP